MIYPSMVPLQEVVTFTYRAPVFDLSGGWRFNSPPTAGGRPPNWNLSGGSAVTPPEVFQEQLDKTWGTRCSPNVLIV